MTDSALPWWTLLCGVGALNVVVWAASSLLFRHRRRSLPGGSRSTHHWHVILSAGYVAGCAYRSFFPVYDVQRIVMFDSWLSSVLVGRSVATFAELCFAAQWALLLRTVGHTYASDTAVKVSRWIVPLIVAAEVCSWYAVLTTSNIGHVMEESLWGLCAAMLAGSLIFLWPRCPRSHRPMIAAACVFGLAYVVYMFKVDVPMYWARWVMDENHGHRYLTLVQGLDDVRGRWIVSRRWVDWESEMLWMTLYFSFAVWLSIGLAHVSHSLGSRGSLRLPAPENSQSIPASLGRRRFFLSRVILE
jgi:hypothetical protein